LSYAESGHGGDKASLLQAINQAVSGLNPKRASLEERSLMKESNVNLNMARDLKSTAGEPPRLQDVPH